MNDSVFGRVKEAVVRDAERILREAGVRHKKTGDGFQLRSEWNAGFVCPMCTDQSGSASFTRELFLKCHQCGLKEDVFRWLSRVRGVDQWSLCKDLADQFNISTKVRPLRGRNMPMRMSPEVLRTSVQDLWESDQAGQMREYLRERHLDDPQLLSELGVGFIKGFLTFAQFDERGRVLERYRGLAPGGRVKWQWFGKGTGGPGIWPAHFPLSDGSTVLLLEGESDVMTALIRLRLQDQGFHPVTWTAGAGSCPHPRDVPRSFAGHECHIAYDNDVFQGPDYDRYFVLSTKGKGRPDQQMKAARQRLSNLLENIGPTFESVGCKVTIRQCPIDPKDNYGGDLRDWTDGGGVNFDDWKQFVFEELPVLTAHTPDVPFDEIFGSLHARVRTRVQVEMVRQDGVLIPSLSKLECPMGQHPCCASCPAMRRFPDRLIPWSEFPRELAVALQDNNMERFLIQNVIEKPRQCPKCELVTAEGITGSEWIGVRPAGERNKEDQRMLHIISTEPPSLSGEVEVTGKIYPTAKGKDVMMMAEKTHSLDRMEVDLETHVHDFLQECPAFTNDVGAINEFLDARWRDLSAHVTKIYGRRDIQIAHDLLAHSAVAMTINDAEVRAWLDICVYGDTRSGKTLTFQRMMDHHGLGIYHTAVSNISRAGLVMGADKQGLLKPGLFPKCNRKMLLLDEWHFLCQQATKDHPMSWLQSARDEGRVSGVKIYGDRALPAHVRFVAIANWIRNRRGSYEFPCEHLHGLYGAPETVARLDFGLAVQGPPEQDEFDDVEHFWNGDRVRSLILRAWNQDAANVLIDQEAVDLAFEAAQSWRDLFDCEDLPLYTPEEKPNSLLRIAIAVANITFSHKQGDYLSVHVRPVHVEWAIEWLRHTWAISGYERYSERVRAMQTVDKPFEAEQWLTTKLGYNDPYLVEGVLSGLRRPFTMSDIVTLTGKDPFDAAKWLSRLRSLHVFEQRKAQNNYHNEFGVTKDGAQLIDNLLTLCRTRPEEFGRRAEQLSRWVGTSEPTKLTPLTAATWEIFDEQGSVPF